MTYLPKRRDRIKIEVPDAFFRAVTGVSYEKDNAFHRWVLRRMLERLNLLRPWRGDAIRLRYGLHDGYQHSYPAIQNLLGLHHEYAHEPKIDLAWIRKGLPTVRKDGTEHAVG